MQGVKYGDSGRSTNHISTALTPVEGSQPTQEASAVSDDQALTYPDQGVDSASVGFISQAKDMLAAVPGALLGVLPRSTALAILAMSPAAFAQGPVLDDPLLSNVPNLRPEIVAVHPGAAEFQEELSRLSKMREDGQIDDNQFLTARMALYAGTVQGQRELPRLANNQVDLLALANWNSGVEFRREIHELVRLRNKRVISPQQFLAARLALYEGTVGSRGNLPRINGGRVDLLELATGVDASASSTRGEAAFHRFVGTIESFMRISAEDRARGDFVELEGAPGYKQLDRALVEDLLTEMFENIPLGEMRGGGLIAQALTRMPGSGGKDFRDMTVNEALDSVEGNAEDWAKANLPKFVKENEVVSAALAFAAVTGLREASPEFAGVMDSLDPKITIWKDNFLDGRGTARARLRYEDLEVLPRLQFDSTVIQPIGQNGWESYGKVSTTFSFEDSEMLTSYAQTGIRFEGDAGRFDAFARVWDDDRKDLSAEFSLYQGPYDFSVDASAMVTFAGDRDAMAGLNDRWEAKIGVNRLFESSAGYFEAFGFARDDINGNNTPGRGASEPEYGVAVQWVIPLGR